MNEGKCVAVERGDLAEGLNRLGACLERCRDMAADALINLRGDCEGAKDNAKNVRRNGHLGVIDELNDMASEVGRLLDTIMAVCQ